VLRELEAAHAVRERAEESSRFKAELVAQLQKEVRTREQLHAAEMEQLMAHCSELELQLSLATAQLDQCTAAADQARTAHQAQLSALQHEHEHRVAELVQEHAAEASAASVEAVEGALVESLAQHAAAAREEALRAAHRKELEGLAQLSESKQRNLEQRWVLERADAEAREAQMLAESEHQGAVTEAQLAGVREQAAEHAKGVLEAHAERTEALERELVRLEAALGEMRIQAERHAEQVAEQAEAAEGYERALAEQSERSSQQRAEAAERLAALVRVRSGCGDHAAGCTAPRGGPRVGNRARCGSRAGARCAPNGEMRTAR
jgi:hypothetical protein